MGCSSSSQAPKGNLGLVVVFGATGKQGGSVVKALLEKRYKTRAVTRNPDSDVAKDLKQKGCEVVQATLDEPEQIKAALSGATHAFLVTQYWEHRDKDKEVQQGRNVIDAAKQCKIKHLVFSGSESSKKEGGIEAPPLDAKSEIEDYLSESGVPYTAVRVPYYMQNFLEMMKPMKVTENEYKINVPMGDKELAVIGVDDIGPCVVSMLESPKEYSGKAIGICGDKVTIEKVCEIMSAEFSPKNFTDGKMTPEDMEKLEVPGAEIMANIFRFFQLGQEKDKELTRKLNPNTKDLEQWIKEHKDAIQKLLE